MSVDRLIAALAAADGPVFVTGAGLSVASGLPAYRTGPDAVWARYVTTWGTRRRMMADPAAWWREFWLKTHADAPADVRPNAGHEAIRAIADAHRGVHVVTQNVDGLHHESGLDDALYEIHGRASLLICCDERCPAWRHPRPAAARRPERRRQPPICGLCGGPARPLVLLFDELYDSHPFYRAREAFAALTLADAIVFVGTSFAVGATELALEHAQRARVPAFSVNPEPFARLHPEAERFAGVVVDVPGKAEELLPEVAARLTG